MHEHRLRPPDLDPYGLYRRLLEIRARELRDRLVRRLVRRCQKQPVGLMAGVGLRNLWEEICIAIRNEHPSASLYESQLEKHLDALIATLPAIDLQTLWLMSYQGTQYATWPERIPGDPDDSPGPSLNPDEWPVDTRKVSAEIIRDVVFEDCFNYENARIRALEGR